MNNPLTDDMDFIEALVANLTAYFECETDEERAENERQGEEWLARHNLKPEPNTL